MARPCRRRCDGRHRWPKNLRRCRLPPCSRPPGFLSSAASAPQGHHRVDDFGLETLAFLFGALMLGGTVKGIVGIAYPMVAVSMMSSVIEVPTAVVLVILPSVASNLLQSGVIRGSRGRPPHLESGGHPPVAPRRADLRFCSQSRYSAWLEPFARSCALRAQDLAKGNKRKAGAGPPQARFSHCQH